MPFLLPVCVVLLTAQMTTIAGTGKLGYSGDGGPALQAQFNQPFLCALDNRGGFFVCDALNHCIRRIDAKGICSTVVGTGKKGYSGDGGPALLATLNEPYAVAVDADQNLYIVDRLNAAIRRVDGRTGVMETLAGTGVPGYSGDGGPARRAQFREPNDCFLDGREGLLVADVADWRIRRIDLRTGLISTFAGTGKPSDRSQAHSSGDGGPATKAVLAGARAVTVDGKGNCFICEREGNAIRKVDRAGLISTVAGTGKKGYTGDHAIPTLATLNGPKGLRCDPAGNLLIADCENHAIRIVDFSRNQISTIAGGRRGSAGDGLKATEAELNRPHGCIVDASGALIICDSENHRVRKVTP
jgi:DNA-binding beta-propeller fold protein YncE